MAATFDESLKMARGQVGGNAGSNGDIPAELRDTLTKIIVYVDLRGISSEQEATHIGDLSRNRLPVLGSGRGNPLE